MMHLYIFDCIQGQLWFRHFQPGKWSV